MATITSGFFLVLCVNKGYTKSKTMTTQRFCTQPSETETPSTIVIPIHMTPVEWSHVHYADKQADTTTTTTQIQANFYPEKTASSWAVLDSFCDRWKAWVPREGAIWLIVNLKSTVFAPLHSPQMKAYYNHHVLHMTLR